MEVDNSNELLKITRDIAKWKSKVANTTEQDTRRTPIISFEAEETAVMFWFQHVVITEIRKW